MRPIRRWLPAIVVVLGAGLLATAWAANVKIGPEDEYDPQINPADFVDGGGDPLAIDNQYFPLEPVTTFIYEDPDGEEHNEVTVTDDTVVILGVTCTVVYDAVWEDDGQQDGIWTDEELVEETYDWYAQDASGNVWYFGEDSMALDENGNWVSDGSWTAGVDGAKPGIIMLANPEAGDSYRQEYYADVAEDLAKVLKLNATAEVPYGDFDSCLKTKEWTTLELGKVEQKTYAPGVGQVLEEEVSGGKTFRSELIDIQ